MEARGREKLFLLNHDESQIIGPNLPSNGQVLRVLFYNLRKVKLNLRTSAHLVIKEVEVLWEKARIPTRKLDRSIEKVESLYQKWKAIQKSCKRRTPLQEKREHDFLEELDDLFDIAHADALEIMSNGEDKEFLINQRKKGRTGSMTGGDRMLFEKERRQILREEKAKSRPENYEANIQEELAELGDPSSTEDEQEVIEDPVERCMEDSMEDSMEKSADESGPSNPKKKRGQHNF